MRRGKAGNKGQHSINLAALPSVLAARSGRLGFNTKFLIEMGGETGLPGPTAICAFEREALPADVLIASDGPRLSAARPTVFLGSRGAVDFDLSLNLRERARHSGNGGGLLRNAAVVRAHALASMVDAGGSITAPELPPPPIQAAVRRALDGLEVGGPPGYRAVDEGWGEPGLSLVERVLGWNSFDILALKSGNPDKPVNTIPPTAMACCQLRFIIGTDWENIGAHLRRHRDRHGLENIAINVDRGAPHHAARPG